MKSRERYRAHMCAAVIALLFMAGAAAIHVPVLVVINAVLFGANIAMAWVVKP